MKYNTIGFIGGGRVVRILLGGFFSRHLYFEKVFVSDKNREVIDVLRRLYPEIIITDNNNSVVLNAELIFLAVHPNILKDVLNEIKNDVKRDSIIISLAPKFNVNMIREILNYDAKIVRVIPNANSIIADGFNPVCFSDNISDEEKTSLRNLLSYLGDSPEVKENKLEAYAVISGMGPTYFWFQFETLLNLALEFGLSLKEAKCAIEKMVSGSVRTIFGSGLSNEEVKDLVPLRPLSEKEREIKEMFTANLRGIYSKLTK